MLKEFKEFAIKGNVVDMAVGIIIGAAFTTVVQSVVNDLLMPPLGHLTGDLDFANQFVLISEGTPTGPYPTLQQAEAAGAVVMRYGAFINAVISFLLVALVLFFLVRWINRLRRPDTPPAPMTRACPFCTEPIHVQATRCKHCTSEIEPVEQQEAAAAS